MRPKSAGRVQEGGVLGRGRGGGVGVRIRGGGGGGRRDELEAGGGGKGKGGRVGSASLADPEAVVKN